MKIFNIIFIVLFILFAALQYNDPDPFIWISFYLYTTFLCFKALKKQLNPILYIIAFFIYSGYAEYLFISDTGVVNWATKHHAQNLAQSMKATSPWIENTREFFGLLIMIGVLLINLVWLNKQQKIVQ